MTVRRGPLSLARLSNARNGGTTTNITRRTVHTVKKLPYDVSKGLGDFLPPNALKVVGHDYQKGLLDRLNDEVKGCEDMENKSIVQTIISASLDRTRVLAFNYASLALNNHFFLDNLQPPPSATAPPSSSPASFPLDHSTQISDKLEMEIRTSHGSLPQLKSTFSAAAMGMFTSGYVWFVTDKSGNTAVVPTFGSGSLLMRSQSYMGSIKNKYDLPTTETALNGSDMQLDLGQWNRGDGLDTNDPYFGEWREDLERRQAEAEAEASSAAQTNPTSPPAPPGTTPSSPASGANTSSALGTSTPPHTRSLHSTASTHSAEDTVNSFSRIPATLITEEPSLAPTRQHRSLTRTEVLTLGETLFPLFCLSVHEHAWLSAGYGVWGKEEWIKKFWGVLDWGKVSKRYEVYAKLGFEKHNPGAGFM